MKASEITGVALYSNNPTEVIETINEHMDTKDQDVFAACARGVGHLARRFNVDVTSLHKKIELRANNFKCSRFVLGAIEDMNADIDQFSS